MINYVHSNEERPVSYHENTVFYRFNDDGGEPVIEVWAGESWETSCGLSKDGDVVLGFFLDNEREYLPLEFSKKHDGCLKVWRSTQCLTPKS